MISPEQTVSSVVLEHSECAPVLQRRRIDFCCRGHQSLAEACARAEVPPDVVLAELERAIVNREASTPEDPRTWPTPRLIRFIVDQHHTYLREALPFLVPLAAKVARVHGDTAASLIDVNGVVIALADALLPHLDTEEQVLFPLLETSPLAEPAASIALAGMLEEHLAVGALLARLRELTDDFAPPEWACNSYRTLFRELEHLEGDVMRHVHLENHVLLPRFASGVHQ